MRAIGNPWVSHYSLQADEITRVVAALRSNNIETNDLKQIGPICFFNLRHIGMEVAAASMILLKTTNDETGMYTFQVLYDTSDKSLFSEKNPLPQVAVFHLGPRAGRAAVTTRMRLADSQKVVAIAEMSDGSFQRVQADVFVTLAACIET